MVQAYMELLGQITLVVLGATALTVALAWLENNRGG